MWVTNPWLLWTLLLCPLKVPLALCWTCKWGADVELEDVWAIIWQHSFSQIPYRMASCNRFSHNVDSRRPWCWTLPAPYRSRPHSQWVYWSYLQEHGLPWGSWITKQRWWLMGAGTLEISGQHGVLIVYTSLRKGKALCVSKAWGILRLLNCSLSET